MVKKKVDTRVRTLIENGIALNHRSFFVIVGDKGRDQIVNLHYILSKATVKARPSVLWCYKKDLGFSRLKPPHRKSLQKTHAHEEAAEAVRARPSRRGESF
jgi:N-acetyltransferase 10